MSHGNNFLTSLQKLGGDGFYGAWCLTYLDLFFRTEVLVGNTKREFVRLPRRFSRD